METKELIYREKNPKDGRGVFIKLTALGKEKREDSKKSVVRFNETVKNQLSEVQIKHFFEVTETINQLISDRLIFESK
jgi:DNA-binding MarR family transcriptional regulator